MPFSQGDSSITRNYGGTGLGLTICKEIVEQYQGSIDVESIYMKGSTFTARLILEVPTDVETISQSKEEMAMLIPTKAKKVLVAEDNEINQKVMIKYLTKQGIDFDIAANGNEAVNLCQTTKYDLIFMDCQMPEFDGLGATSIIRESIDANVPIIAMTAFSSLDDKKRCFDAGMNGFIMKPVDFKTVGRYLGIDDDNSKKYNSNLTEIMNKSKVTVLHEQYATNLAHALNFDYETCLDLVETYTEQGKLFFVDIEEFYHKKDTLALEKKLHQFKGATGALRFDAIMKRIIEAEQLVKNNDIERAFHVIQQLKKMPVFVE